MDDKFGINMKQYCREYEESVRGGSRGGGGLPRDAGGAPGEDPNAPA